MSEEKNKFIALYHFLDKPQDFNLEMNYYEFRDELKNLLDLYQKEKEKNKELFEEYNKRVATIIEYEQGIKSFLDDTNITNIEPWNEYKIKGQLLFDLQELLEERN